MIENSVGLTVYIVSSISLIFADRVSNGFVRLVPDKLRQQVKKAELRAVISHAMMIQAWLGLFAESIRFFFGEKNAADEAAERMFASLQFSVLLFGLVYLLSNDSISLRLKRGKRIVLLLRLSSVLFAGYAFYRSYSG